MKPLLTESATFDVSGVKCRTARRQTTEASAARSRLATVTAMEPTHAFIVSVDSTREVDLTGKRIRRLEGVRSPTGREGDRSWRSFVWLTPDPPRLGVPLITAWSEDARAGVIRATRTSPTVGVFLEDPTAGPFAWTGEADAAESTPGAVLVDGVSVRTATAMAAHTICALANVGCQYRGFAAPEAVFSIRRVEAAAALTVGGYPVATGDLAAVVRLVDALGNLPPPAAHFGGAVVAASVPGGVSWSAPPIAALPRQLLREALRAFGLTEAEVGQQVDLASLARAASAAEEFLGSAGAVGRWLRCPHRALRTRRPLAVLAAGGDVGPALADPYSGGEPATWEPEAIACWRAANAAGWASVELRRDRHEGRWRVTGTGGGARLIVADSLYGVTGRVEGGAGQRGDVVLERPVDPERAPARLVACLDRGPGHPGSCGRRP